MAVNSYFWTNASMFIAVIRFALFSPAIIYWVAAADHHELIRINPELHDGIYGTSMLAGERLADKWGIILWIWNLACWWPALVCFPPLNLPFTIVDTTITVFLAMATNYQVGYIPLNLKACHDKAGLELQRPAGTNESFFAAAGRLNETTASSTAMCLEFVKEAQYGVALTFFYALVSFIGVLAFPGAILEIRKNDDSILDMVKEILKMHRGCFACMFKWPALLVYGVLVYTPILFFRYLPMDFKAPVRSVRRYVTKATIGAEQKIEMMLTERIKHASNSGDTVLPCQGSGGTQNELSRFLAVYDMLIMVAKDLHYTDIASLSSVSKSVRESVLPSNDVSSRIGIFRRYTCDPGEKNTCWACTNQMCDGCEEYSFMPHAPALHHLENCVPYCASCYHTHIVRNSRNRRSRAYGNPTCDCVKRNSIQQQRAFWGFFNRHAYYTEMSLSQTTRQLCRICSQLDSTELAVRKTESAMRLLRKGLKSDGGKWKTCAVLECGRRLGSGPRYWVCKGYLCDKECKSTIHPAWGSKTDAGVTEEAIA